MRPEDTVPLRRDQIPFMRIIYGSENVYYSYDVFKENVNELGQSRKGNQEGHRKHRRPGLYWYSGT